VVLAAAGTVAEYGKALTLYLHRGVTDLGVERRVPFKQEFFKALLPIFKGLALIPILHTAKPRREEIPRKVPTPVDRFIVWISSHYSDYCYCTCSLTMKASHIQPFLEPTWSFIYIPAISCYDIFAIQSLVVFRAEASSRSSTHNQPF
jgi:hypothetical protein